MILFSFHLGFWSKKGGKEFLPTQFSVQYYLLRYYKTQICPC